MEVTRRGQRVTFGRYPISDTDAHRISLRAAELAKNYAPKGPRRSYLGIRATWSTGQVGVHIPPDAIHLYYLNNGIKPFVMWNLEGKTIPIREADGSISYRTAKNVGRPKILTRDERGRIVQSKLSWRFPGTQPLHFIERAIEEAIQEYVVRQRASGRRQMVQRAMGVPSNDLLRL